MSLERRHKREPERRKKSEGDEMWQNLGLDVDSMSPTAQVATGAIVVGVVAVAALAIFEFLPFIWWSIFIFGWSVFPAFGLFLRGISGMLDSDEAKTPQSSTERQLLEALSRTGEMTPAQAAMETSMTVREADDMMRELASGGHLEVRVRGAAIFYSLWGDDGVGKREESGEM